MQRNTDVGLGGTRARGDRAICAHTSPQTHRSPRKWRELHFLAVVILLRSSEEEEELRLGNKVRVDDVVHGPPCACGDARLLQEFGPL